MFLQAVEQAKKAAVWTGQWGEALVAKVYEEVVSGGAAGMFAVEQPSSSSERANEKRFLRYLGVA